jgi:TetR/AcrR family transcriptional regulator, transcriptional repressor for nem operon
MAKGEKAGRSPDRAQRTRACLVDTALRVFNEVGFWGTDSNALARQAGFSPGTFYRHFSDKRAIFLAAYQAWIDTEQQVIAARVARLKDRRSLTAGAFVDYLIEHHGRWRTFRASLRALAPGDPELQRAIRVHRKQHLDVLGELLGRRELARGLAMLYTLDGLTDALADNEPHHLGIKAKHVTDTVRGLVVR